MQQISQSAAPGNIELNDTRFTPDIEEDPSKNTRQEPRDVPKAENKHNTFESLPPEPYVNEGPTNEVALTYKSHKRPVNKECQNT